VNGVEIFGGLAWETTSPSRENVIPRVRPRTPSSVAIQFTPRLCAIERTSSETLPSDGHIPLAECRHFFVKVEAALGAAREHLLVAEAILWQGQAGGGHCALIGVADERKNWVVESRG